MTQDTDALRLWTQLTLVRDVRLARERHAVSEARMVVEHAALGVQSARAALARHFVAEGAIVEACRREAPASEGWLATLRAHRGEAPSLRHAIEEAARALDQAHGHAAQALHRWERARFLHEDGGKRADVLRRRILDDD
ncbi:hypothetical protein AWB67_01086 [Caballeronia terrestris]|uniref:Type III secretion protein HrpB7 n=1 Tax=Caballeronia terrestris TaxID=1226301 RepID=A0A158G3Q7_9BURK|nr:hypothetical protein [Caballeronia terrestris]SAL26553.1 hypothetical protein AWB67_01086 [Caballeronia terrestris]